MLESIMSITISELKEIESPVYSKTRLSYIKRIMWIFVKHINSLY